MVNRFTRPNPLPGPLPLPFIGNLLNFTDVRLFYENCQKKYGDVCEISLAGLNYVILSRPEYIEKILSPTSFIVKTPQLQGLEELGFYNRGVAFNEDYKSWSYNRRFFSRALLGLKFMNLTITSTNKLYEEMKMDFSAWFHAFMNDLVSILTVGERTYSIASYYNTQSTIKSKYLNTLIEDGDRFVKRIVKLSKDLLFFVYIGPTLRHYFPIYRIRSYFMLKNRDCVFETLDNMIKKRRKEIEEMPIGAEMKTDMLTSLIIANTIRGDANVEMLDDEMPIPMSDSMTGPMSDDMIRGDLLDAYSGGTDAIANAFCFITYYLCKNPHVKQKMLLEIDSIFPKGSNKSYVSDEDLPKLKYCKAIIKETFRIMPVVVLTPRQLAEDCELAGYKLPAGTQMFLNFLGANFHPKVWTYPEVFNPDRFYNEEDIKVDAKYLPIFGGNLRLCPGRRLTITALLLLLALVYKNYDIELVNFNEPLKLFMGGILNCKELKVRISPRN
ncbi:15415_t:CDS:2 [Cetraspora pellucida]|uniref:15415_t:CDS:1 n=1 Tax=Cetraspora pellucida TaxID=1433469 RepID=A0A9N9EH77_9GLOM|nr:15415_t:CDS:2 [Cetraspora pellucida]